jgi:hypothetical protein
MDKNFCQQIDQESLVEKYVAGKLRGDLLDKFEQHLIECEDHAQSVLLEKALKRGVTEFARGEIKTRLRDRLKKREDTRFMMLRYAAILLVAVITPLILYYQINVAPQEMVESGAEAKKDLLSEDADITDQEEEQKKDESTTELKARESVKLVEEEQPVQPSAPAAGASYNKPQERVILSEDEKQKTSQDDVLSESAKLDDMLKAAEPASTPEFEADYPIEQESSTKNDRRGVSAYKTSSLKAPQESVQNVEINKMVIQDSLAIRKCIDSFLSESEREKYNIDLHIQVGKSGTISEIKIIRTSHQSSDLEDCLFNLIKTWTISEDNKDRQVLQAIRY